MSYCITISGEKFPIFDWLTSDPYFKIIIDDKEYKSEVINDNLNPVWKPIEVYASTPWMLNFGKTTSFYTTDHDVPVTVEIWDSDCLNPDDFMGKVVLPLKDFLETGVHDLMDKRGNLLEDENGEQSRLSLQILSI